jgi:hypothetical protein
MSSSNTIPRGVTGFAVGTFVVSVSLYVAHLFLPVAGPAPWGAPDSTVPGVTGTLASFVFPPLWPFAIGHLLFLGSSILFLAGRSPTAARCALLALAVSVAPRLLFFPFYGPWMIGIMVKWLAMIVLWFASAIRE